MAARGGVPHDFLDWYAENIGKQAKFSEGNATAGGFIGGDQGLGNIHAFSQILLRHALRFSQFANSFAQSFQKLLIVGHS